MLSTIIEDQRQLDIWLLTVSLPGVIASLAFARNALELILCICSLLLSSLNCRFGGEAFERMSPFDLCVCLVIQQEKSFVFNSSFFVRWQCV